VVRTVPFAELNLTLKGTAGSEATMDTRVRSSVINGTVMLCPPGTRRDQSLRPAGPCILMRECVVCFWHAGHKLFVGITDIVNSVMANSAVGDNVALLFKGTTVVDPCRPCDSQTYSLGTFLRSCRVNSLRSASFCSSKLICPV